MFNKLDSCSDFLLMTQQKTKIPTLAAEDAVLVFYNGVDCPTKIALDGIEEFQIHPLSSAKVKIINIQSAKKLRNVKIYSECKRMNLLNLDSVLGLDYLTGGQVLH